VRMNGTIEHAIGMEPSSGSPLDGLIPPATRTPPARFVSDVVVELGLASRQDVEAAAARAAEGRTEQFAPDSPDEPRFEPLPQPEPQSPPAEQDPMARESDNGEPRRRRGLLWGRRERSAAEGAAAPIADSDAEDAHVMALNMALNGTPREETEGYLRQRFAGVDDLDSILDDVYGRVKGR
jgi:hypothetical protein